jgi:hypothetical protein
VVATRADNATPERVREAFDYDPSTGIVTRRITLGSRAMAGSVVGTFGGKYLQVVLDRKYYKMHRLIWCWMTGRWVAQVDHIDRDALNNKWENLREATASQQQGNTGLSSRNTSGFRGVQWVVERDKWRAVITRNGKITNLGYSSDLQEAAAVAASARKEYFGEFFAG